MFRKNRNFRPKYFAVSWKRHKTGQWLQRNINRKSHTQVILVRSDILYSDLERWDARDPVFFQRNSIRPYGSIKIDQIRHGNPREEWSVCKVRHALVPRGRTPAHPNFLVPFDVEFPVGMVTHVREGRIFGGQLHTDTNASRGVSAWYSGVSF